MTDEERTGVRGMINQTIERLQMVSVGANHMGSRYARLLQLLWRKAPKVNGASHKAHQPTQLATPHSAYTQQSQDSVPPSESPISSYRLQPQQLPNQKVDPDSRLNAAGMSVGV